MKVVLGHCQPGQVSSSGGFNDAGNRVTSG